MKCQRCGNTNPQLFYKDHGVWYCRKCVGFSRMNAGERPRPAHVSHHSYHVKPNMSFSLTAHQRKVSDDICMYLKQGKDVFVYAATGAGKTECTYASIVMYLEQGKKVAFAISRRQVVLEIKDRLQEVFPSLSVIAVAKDHTEVTDGDIIVCTMHQLYRYPYTFDLLICDEVDAFPYIGNDVLEAMTKQACIGQKVYLSATPDPVHFKAIEENKMKMVCLFERPHKHPLIIPKVIQVPTVLQLLYIYFYCFQWIHDCKQVLLFVPRRQDTLWISKLLSFFFKVECVDSTTENKDVIMEAFRSNTFDILVTTTLLERGITVPSVQVIVYRANHIVFTTASLIQIFGRVGRSFKDPEGQGVCLCQYSTDAIKDCVHQLHQMNNSV